MKSRYKYFKFNFIYKDYLTNVMTFFPIQYLNIYILLVIHFITLILEYFKLN